MKKHTTKKTRGPGRGIAKNSKKNNVYVLGLSNESASWHLLDPYQMFWPNMCICMPVYVQSCSAYSAEARRHFESICLTLSQRATQRCETMSNSFETDTCSTRSLLILRVCPPKIRNWTKPYKTIIPVSFFDALYWQHSTPVLISTDHR